MWIPLDRCSMTDEKASFIFIKFPDSLPINYITLKLASYLEVALGITKCHHQNGGITNTGTTWLLFNHESVTDERDPSTIYTLYGQYGHQLHYIEVGPPT
jgi:hypothetical protein